MYKINLSINGVVYVSRAFAEGEPRRPLFQDCLAALESIPELVSGVDDRKILIFRLGDSDDPSKYALMTFATRSFNVIAEDRPNDRTPSSYVWMSKDPNFAEGKTLPVGLVVRKGPWDADAEISTAIAAWNESYENGSAKILAD